MSPEQLDAGPRQVDAVEAEAEAPTASKLEEALPEEAPPQDAFTQAQGVIRGRLKCDRTRVPVWGRRSALRAATTS